MTPPLIDLVDTETAVVQMEDKSVAIEDAMKGNSTFDGDNDIDDKHRAHLSAKEIWNIMFCFLAWACNVSIVTLGTFLLST